MDKWGRFGEKLESGVKREQSKEVGRKWGGSGEKVGRTRFGGQQHKVLLNDEKWGANGAEVVQRTAMQGVSE